MINKKIVVAALCRDCNDSLINNIPRIEKLCSLFAESCVVVVENDSKDGTKESLARWADNNKSVAVIGEDSGELTITKPTNDDLEYCAIPNQHKKIKAYCEHIPFNEKIIAKGGALYISKYYDVRYRSESFAKMLCRKFNKLILKKRDR